MAIDRKRFNPEGNIRVDLPDFRDMLDNCFADFQFLIRSYLDGSGRRVIKRYQQGAHVGLTFKLKQDVARAAQDSTQEWFYKTPAAGGTTIDTALDASQTNYVQARVDLFLDDLQTRAFWDTDIGLTGEEFFDDINVRLRVDEAIESNIVGFDADAIPLFTVVTGVATITSVTEAPNSLLWKPRTVALPAAASRDDIYTSIVDLATMVDWWGGLVAEMKGTSQGLESAAWSNLKILREYENTLFDLGGVVGWQTTPASGKIAWAADLKVDVPGRAGGPYTIDANVAGTVIADGSCMYVDVTEGAPGGSLAPVVSTIAALPTAPTAGGFSPRILVMWARRGTVLYGLHGLPTLDAGDQMELGKPASLQRIATIANNQGAAADVAGLVLDHTIYQAAVVEGALFRKTDTPTEQETIVLLYLFYNPRTAVWRLEGPETKLDETAVVFSITAGGQVQYTSDLIAGGAYVGTFNYRIRSFNAFV